MKRTYNKRENITDTTFDFTQQKVQYQIQYQGNGKAPDKRYDKSIQGLCLFVYPSGIKTFYAMRFLEQYNKKKTGPKRTLFIKRSFVWKIIHKETMQQLN